MKKQKLNRCNCDDCLARQTSREEMIADLLIFSAVITLVGAVSAIIYFFK